MPLQELDFERFKETVKKSFNRAKRDILEQSKRLKELEVKNLELGELMQDILKELREIKNYVYNTDRPKSKNSEKKANISAYDKILALLALGPISTTQLKSIMVDKEQLCSKATFYRYIKNLINKGKVIFVKEGDSSVLMLSQNQHINP